MPNIKFVSIFSAFGFILSFMFGLFSHSKFLIILLKAFIFALIFAAIGVAISILYKKFLADDREADSIQENVPNNNSAAPVRGQHIDIVADQELEADESNNSFEVGDNYYMLQKSDMLSSPEKRTESALKHDQTETVQKSDESVVNNTVSANSSKTEAKTDNSGFIPLTNFEKVDKSKVVGASNTNNTVQSQSSGSSSDDEIDTLPDMGSFSFVSSDGTQNEVEDDDADDEDFDTTVSSSSTSRNNNSPEIEIKDAALMAKAISSILSGEDS